MKNSLRKYHKDSTITFRSTKGKYGGLSNMAPGYPIQLNGTTVRSSELLYQALRFSGNPIIQQKLISIISPITAKQYGRSHIEKTRKDWEKYRFKIMRFCIEVKLDQNYSKFSKLLLETGNLSIVEYSLKDKVWGASKIGNFYEGTNALGRLLMELREKVRLNTFELKVPASCDLIFLGERITINNKING